MTTFELNSRYYRSILRTIWNVTVDVRLERLDHLAAKFKLKCDIHEAWSRGKEDMLQAQDFKKCRLSDLKVMTMASVHIVCQVDYR